MSYPTVSEPYESWSHRKTSMPAGPSSSTKNLHNKADTMPNPRITRRKSLRNMFHAMHHSNNHNNDHSDDHLHSYQAESTDRGLNRDQVFEAFASHADTSFDDPSQPPPTPRKGRRKSLLSAFESKLSKKASKAANESNLTLPVVPTRSSSILHSPSSSSSSSVPKSSLRRHASSGSNNQKQHAEYYQPALRPIGSHSHRDRQASIDSDISKVSTFDLDLFSIDDPKPLQKKSSSKAGRRLSAVDTGESKVSLRPKAKSLRDIRRSQNNNGSSSNNNSSNISSWQSPADELEMKQSLSSSHRTPRSRSRVLRSPPPPPQSDRGMEQLPSMPNVDVKQIKVELETPRATTAVGMTAPRAEVTEQSNKSRRADQHLTANVLSNVKRRLSLGKDRNRSSKEAAATTANTGTTTGTGRQSLPATFLRKTRSSSRTHSLAVDRRKSPSSGAESPPPPLPAAGHFGSIARRRHQSAEQYEVDEPEIIPPVPPVPKHHSVAKKESSGHLEVNHAQSRASSASSGPAAVSGDEHQQQQQQLRQQQPRSSHRSLRRKTSRHSSFGDVEDSDPEDAKTKKSSERRMSRPESVKESFTSLWRKRSTSKTSKLKDKTENAPPAQPDPSSTTQTSTVRKRGKVT